MDILLTGYKVNIVNEKTAKDVWRKLKEQFGGDDRDKKINLRRDLANIKWENGDNVEKYINKIERVTAELVNIGDKIDKADISSYILNGLPSQYRNVKRVFEAIKPSEITPHQVRFALMAEENNQKEMDQKAGQAFKMKSSKSYVQDFQSKECFTCGKYGHLSKNCWHNPKNKKYNYKMGGNMKQNTEEKKNSNRSYSKGGNKYHIKQVKHEDNEYDNKYESDNGDTKQSAFKLEEEYFGNKNSKKWVLDSGATRHITNDKSFLSNFVGSPVCGEVSVADGRVIKTMGIGSIELIPNYECIYSSIIIDNVVLAPDLDDNLLSVSELDISGLNIKFKNGTCQIYDNFDMIIQGKMINDLYRVNAETKRVENQVMTIKVNNKELWHKRMGHLNYDTLVKMEKEQSMRGMTFDSKENIDMCQECILGKMTRESFTNIGTNTTQSILELIFMDLIGPIDPPSLGGSRYILNIIDDYSRRIKVYFLKHKFEAVQKIKEFINLVENEIGKKVQTVRTDNGREFVNDEVETFFKNKGIEHQKSVPYCPEQMGTVERANRTILDVARTLLVDAHLPKYFWAEAIATAVYLRNRSLNVKRDKTPEEIWKKKRPTAAHLKVFGCLSYAWLPKQFRKKFDMKATPSIMVGYAEDMKAYRLYDPKHRKFFACKHPKFFEDKKGYENLVKVENETDVMNKKEFMNYDVLFVQTHEENDQRVEQENIEEKKEGKKDAEPENDDGEKDKKKKKKGAKDAKEDKDAKAGKGPGKKTIAAMQEALKKIKEEEERMKRKEEERIKREEEAEKARLEALRLEQERKDKKKKREKERKERLKAEGKLLNAKQKADRARAQALIEAMKAQGVDLPEIGEKKAPRPGTRIKPSKLKQQQSVEKETASEEAKSEEKKVEVEIVEQKEAEKKEAVEDVKDSWDAKRSEDMIADIFTKGVGNVKLKEFKTEMGLL